MWRWNPFLQALASLQAPTTRRRPVATTEPVGDYMLARSGHGQHDAVRNLQADIMNGVDPAPQDISLQTNLFRDHRIKVFLCDQQVTDTLTRSFS